MIDVASVKEAFPELEELAALPVPRSGQKEVLLGKRRANGEQIVLKLIKPSATGGERTVREIEAVARLKSEFVPRVFEYGKRRIGADERVFLVEQFVAGGNYRELLRSTPKPPLKRVLQLGTVLLQACVDFERTQIVHRDIKPENIMVGDDQKVWVIDFGLVRLLDMESLTATEQHFGPCTPGYGAPEQVRNLKSQIDVRADLYSIGLVLYESLNGSNPHLVGKADVLEVIRSMESRDLPSLTGVDSELDAFVCALAARFPSRRPQSASEAVDWFTPIKARLSEE